jgi:septal ring factor EnvC (AmiA/AmiB activator)
MKASVWIIAVILAILALIFGILWMGAANKTKALQKSNEELQKLYDNSTATISEIQSSLEALDKDLSGSIATGGELPAGTPEERRARIVESISNMRSQIEADKKRIANLEAQLANSRGQLSSIQAIVEKLKASVADKEMIVSELEGRLTNLNQTLNSERQLSQEEIAKREAQIKEKQATIENQNQEANRLYYAVGTRKELIAKDIIDRKGGILGIGKVSTVAKDLEAEKFVEFNLLETQTISFPVTNKGYAILSNHIASSYRVDKKEGLYVLTVTNPELFRKQKFLVIELL